MTNPWGVDAYTGEWSDNSPLWTDALRAEAGATVNDQDGAFYQTIE